MSSGPATSSLFRSRPPRPPANSSKPLQASSRLTTTTVTASSTTSQLHSTTTNVSLFLTNLRLLDLDLHPDWPDINPLTFSAKDAAQGQKKRIQCVEWALYQLFYLWDPEEARNKLRPFFPPLDQVQSLNLRAALLRCLEQAKKNGVLGRDVLIRKTMLDECKGERMEEVLAVFSSAVLKNLVAEQQLNQSDHPAVALTLALENRGYSGQTTDLSILSLAHRACLSRQLRDKDAARERYSDFSEVLDLKRRTLTRRREQAKALEAQEKETGNLQDVDKDVKHDLWRTVRNNWSGDERWLETLLHGDMHAQKDGLLSTPFDKVWRRVQAGRLSELEDHSDGLLQQLDRRVTRQKERLEKWRAFRREIGGPTSSNPQEGNAKPLTRQKGIDLGFGAHENLQLGRLSPRKLPRSEPGQLSPEYSHIVDSLRQELARVGESVPPKVFAKVSKEPAEQHLEPPHEEVVSEISELEEEDHMPQDGRDSPADILPTTEVNAQRNNAPTVKEPEATDDEESPIVQPRRSPVRQNSASIVSKETPSTAASPEKAMRPTTPVSRSPVRGTPSPRKTSPPRVSPGQIFQPQPPSSPPKTLLASPDQALSPTQALADQILASMNAASPSPVKKPRHTLSLAERTRLSMARRNSRGPRLDEDDDDGEPDIPFAIRSPPSVTVSPAQPNSQAFGTLPTPTEEAGEPQRGYEDLVSRTRRSMAGFDAAKKKAQLERRRSQRQSSRPMPPAPGHRRDGSSYFPAVDEEMGDTTLLLAEELMANEQDDYEAIFKSRPKVKTSPVGSPVKGWED